MGARHQGLFPLKNCCTIVHFSTEVGYDRSGAFVKRANRAPSAQEVAQEGPGRVFMWSRVANISRFFVASDVYHQSTEGNGIALNCMN